MESTNATGMRSIEKGNGDVFCKEAEREAKQSTRTDREFQRQECIRVKFHIEIEEIMAASYSRKKSKEKTKAVADSSCASR